MMRRVEIPACLLSEELFSGSRSGERIENLLLLEVDRPDERMHFTLNYSGPGLGPEHLRLWKAMYIQKMLRGRDQFRISAEQIMQLLGYERCESEQQGNINCLLHDLSYTHLSGAGSWYTQGGKKHLFRVASRFGEFHVRDGICRAFVGPGLEGFPDKLAIEVLLVSEEEIEIASRPPPDPPTPRWLDEPPPSTRPKPSGPGFVYILTNPSMPGLIKIGKTRLDRVEDRAAQLHSTGVPDAFEVAYACRTNDPDAVERVMHEAFGPRRVNGRREFFQVAPQQAIAVLSLHG